MSEGWGWDPPPPWFSARTDWCLDTNFSAFSTVSPFLLATALASDHIFHFSHPSMAKRTRRRTTAHNPSRTSSGGGRLSPSESPPSRAAAAVAGGSTLAGSLPKSSRRGGVTATSSSPELALQVSTSGQRQTSHSRNSRFTMHSRSSGCAPVLVHTEASTVIVLGD